MPLRELVEQARGTNLTTSTKGEKKSRHLGIQGNGANRGGFKGGGGELTEECPLGTVIQVGGST